MQKVFIVKRKGERAYRIRPVAVRKPSWMSVHYSTRIPRPHLEKEPARVDRVYYLSDVRVVEDAAIVAKIQAWEETEKRIRKERQELLDREFLTFRLAEFNDFTKVEEGTSKEEAQGRLKSVDREKAEERHKFLSAFSKELAKMGSKRKGGK